MTSSVRVDGGAEAPEELSGTGDDELSAVFLAHLVGGDAGDVFARNTPRGGDGDNVMSASMTAGAGQYRLYRDGNNGLTAAGASGNILSGVMGDDKISASEGDDTVVLDPRRPTAGETRDTNKGFDPAADRLAFFGLTHARAPLGCVDTCDCLEPVTAQERHACEDQTLILCGEAARPATLASDIHKTVAQPSNPLNHRSSSFRPASAASGIEASWLSRSRSAADD